jgi:hypothetical protein
MSFRHIGRPRWPTQLHMARCKHGPSLAGLLTRHLICSVPGNEKSRVITSHICVITRPRTENVPEAIELCPRNDPGPPILVGERSLNEAAPILKSVAERA